MSIEIQRGRNSVGRSAQEPQSDVVASRAHAGPRRGNANVARSGDEMGSFFGSGDAEASFSKNLGSEASAEASAIYIYIYIYIFLHLYSKQTSQIPN